MADLVDGVFARCGIIPQPEPELVVASHGAVAENHRAELIRLLKLGEAQTGILAAMVANQPDDDRAFDLVDKGLGETFAAAGVELLNGESVRDLPDGRPGGTIQSLDPSQSGAAAEPACSGGANGRAPKPAVAGSHARGASR